jgi:hypothetical protein
VQDRALPHKKPVVIHAADDKLQRRIPDSEILGGVGLQELDAARMFFDQ